MMTPRRQLSERGMTLIEMLIALTVFSIVLAGALAFLRAQGRSFTLGSQRSAMLQNSRFAFDELEKDLRTAGAGTLDKQPAMIYADTNVVAFNANYASRTPGDVFAVYYDPDVPIGAADAARRSDRFTIPTTPVAYPDSDYLLPGGLINSPAETITFFFVPDSTTSRPDDYVLFRQVNNQAPELVARNLLRTGGVPFFQYYVQELVAGSPVIQQVPRDSLPLWHSVPFHLAIADVGAAARIDSVRAVLVSFSVTNGLSGSSERRRPLSRYIRLPNVGLSTKQTCGDPPILGSAITAAWNAGTNAVDLTWGAAVDELAGERDVVRYVLWRKSASDSSWGDPFLSFPPAGTPTYVYTDHDVTSGSKYIYGLAAQDCTPANSNLVASAEVDIP